MCLPRRFLDEAYELLWECNVFFLTDFQSDVKFTGCKVFVSLEFWMVQIFYMMGLSLFQGFCNLDLKKKLVFIHAHATMSGLVLI